MNASYQFLQYLQTKKKKLHQQCKQTKVDLEQIQHRFQTPSVKIQKVKISMTEQQFIYIVKAAKSKLLKQPSLLKIDAPVFVATGTYGSYHELSLIFEKCGNPKFVNYLFLGNYTGKYNNGIQCLVALLTYKIKFNLNFFLLRGVYETIQMSKSSALYTEIINHFGSPRAWTQVCELFCCMPFAAIINQKIFCVHGGINPYIFTLQQISQIYRPFNTSEKGLPHDLVFGQISYHNEKDDEQFAEVQESIFNQEDTQSFMKRTGVKLIARGGSIIENGFELAFEQSIANLCSVSNFCNIYHNSSAVMIVDDQLNVVFKQISGPISSKNQQNEEGLTFLEIVEKRQQRKNRLQQLQQIETQKYLQNRSQKVQKQVQKQKKDQKRKEKQEKKKIRRLKRQMLQQKYQKQQNHSKQKEKQQLGQEKYEKQSLKTNSL